MNKDTLITEEQAAVKYQHILEENAATVRQLMARGDIQGLERMAKDTRKSMAKRRLTPHRTLQTMAWCESMGFDFKHWLRVSQQCHEMHSQTLKMIEQAMARYRYLDLPHLAHTA